MPTRRVITGIGQATNPFDGDRVMVEIGLREGKIATAGAPGMFVGQLTYSVGGQPEFREFKTATEARAHGDTFAGCETARTAARHIYAVFGRLSLEDALAVPLDTFVVAVGAVELRGRWCVTAVFQAVRRALIDAQTRILAEEIVESRRVRVGS